MKTSNEYRPPTELAPEVIQELAETNHVLFEKHKSARLYDELMQIKKNRQNQDIKLQPLFFNIGMVVSLLMVIIAINWRSNEHAALVDLGVVKDDVNEIIEIPISKQPPPPPPKQEVFKIAEVKDTEIVEDIEVNLDVEVTADAVVEEITFEAPIEEEVVDEVFVIVETEPMPQGGIDAFYAYLAKTLIYPSSAIRLGVSGKVFVQFVVEKDGTITQVEVVKGIGAGCDEEAIRVIQNAPKWSPGKQRGLPVRVKKIIPVHFMMKSH